MKKSRFTWAKSLIMFGIIFSTEACFDDCLNSEYKERQKYILTQNTFLDKQESLIKDLSSDEVVDIRQIQHEVNKFDKNFKEYLIKNTLNNSGNPLEVSAGNISAYYLNKLSENIKGFIHMGDKITKTTCFDGRLVTSKSLLEAVKQGYENKIEEIKKLPENKLAKEIQKDIEGYQKILNEHKAKIDARNKKNKNTDEKVIGGINDAYKNLIKYLDTSLDRTKDIDISINCVQNAINFINTIENSLSKQLETKEGNNNTNEMKILEVKEITSKLTEARGVSPMPLINTARQQELEKNCFVGNKLDLSFIGAVMLEKDYDAELHYFATVHNRSAAEKILQSAMGDLYKPEMRLRLVNTVYNSPTLEDCIKALKEYPEFKDLTFTVEAPESK